MKSQKLDNPFKHWGLNRVLKEINLTKYSLSLAIREFCLNPTRMANLTK